VTLWLRRRSCSRRLAITLSFDDFETLLARLGWVKRGQEGSHRLWYSQKGHRLPIQPSKNGKAKAYQVKQFLDAIEEE
ncbi:MAG: type II toxin-antitoxin system HicA family toxin, partial [Gammaproteobacteria bacterium]